MIFIVIPEIAWYCYGYSFIFENTTEDCRTEQNSLWICVLILLVYGMFFIVFCLGVLCFACGVYYMYISWSAHPTDSTTESKKEMENLPVLGEAIRKRRLATHTRITDGYDSIRSTYEPSSHCAICDVALLHIDPVETCRKSHHVMHSDCFEKTGK